jgi:hypothetical protein
MSADHHLSRANRALEEAEARLERVRSAQVTGGRADLADRTAADLARISRGCATSSAPSPISATPFATPDGARRRTRRSEIDRLRDSLLRFASALGDRWPAEAARRGHKGGLITNARHHLHDAAKDLVEAAGALAEQLLGGD